MALLEASSTYQIIDKDHERVGRWIHAQGGAPWREGTTCIGLERRGELVAATSYDYFNGAMIHASIVIQGPITRKWLWFIFAYPFVQLKASVILGLIPCDNLKSIHLAERMGFKSVGDIPDGDPSGLLCLYALHRNECRFLKGY